MQQAQRGDEEPQYPNSVLRKILSKNDIVRDYIVIQRFSNGGILKRHRLVTTDDTSYSASLEIAYDKAIRGSKVFILPELQERDPLRETIFNGAKENKCPDLLVDGVFVEIKTPVPKLHHNKIDNNVKFAYSQANYVVIRIVEEYCIRELKRIAKSRFLLHRELEVIEFKVVGRYFRCDRRIMLKK